MKLNAESIMYCGYQARYTQDFISESEHCLLIREGTFNVKYLVDMQTANFIEKMSPISAWVSEIQKGRLNVYAESEPKGRKSSGGPSKEPLWLLYNCMGLGCWGHSACAQVCPVWFVNHEVSVAKCTPSTLDAHTHKGYSSQFVCVCVSVYYHSNYYYMS